MSIGPGKPFESIILSLPEKGEKTNPGSELFVFFFYYRYFSISYLRHKQRKYNRNIKEDWDWK